MHAAFTDDQQELRRHVRAALVELCPPRVVRSSATDRNVVRTIWAAVADLGLLGVLSRPEVGGLGLDARDAITLAEECGYAGLPGPFVDNVWVVAPLLDQHEGTDATELLTDLVRGSRRFAVQSDANALVADLDVADLVCTLDGDRAELHTTADRAPVSVAGVDGGRPIFRVLAATRPAQYTTATGGQSAFDRGALGNAAFALGLGRRMLDLAVEYARIREQFGRPIGSCQAVQHHLANAAVALTFAAPLVWRAAWSIAVGHPHHSANVSMAHLRATAAAQLAGRAALQVHGAIGYTTEHDLHLYLKRVWSIENAWGDQTFHYHRIAAALDRTDPKEYWDA